MPLMFSLLVANISHFLTTTTKFSCFLSNGICLLFLFVCILSLALALSLLFASAWSKKRLARLSFVLFCFLVCLFFVFFPLKVLVAKMTVTWTSISRKQYTVRLHAGLTRIKKSFHIGCPVVRTERVRSRDYQTLGSLLLPRYNYSMIQSVKRQINNCQNDNDSVLVSVIWGSMIFSGEFEIYKSSAGVTLSIEGDMNFSWVMHGPCISLDLGKAFFLQKICSQSIVNRNSLDLSTSGAQTFSRAQSAS